MLSGAAVNKPPALPHLTPLFEAMLNSPFEVRAKKKMRIKEREGLKERERERERDNVKEK